MNFRHIWAIAKKDLRDAMGNISVWLPMVIVPLIFVVILPLVMILVGQTAGASALNDPDLQTFFANMPASMSTGIAGMDPIQQMIYIMLGFFFAPMFLIIPLMFSTTISAESFAGERERKTFEALLYSPATDSELFLGKVLAGLLPAIVLSWASFLGYTIVLNAAGWPIFGRIWFPLTSWYPLIFWVTPAIAVLGVTMTVLISKKVKTFQGAYQTSASTVVLVLALVVGQATGILYLSVAVGIAMGVVIWVADAVLAWLAVKTFNRKALLAGGD